MFVTESGQARGEAESETEQLRHNVRELTDTVNQLRDDIAQRAGYSGSHACNGIIGRFHGQRGPTDKPTTNPTASNPDNTDIIEL